jgi:hypothetical protein
VRTQSHSRNELSERASTLIPDPPPAEDATAQVLAVLPHAEVDLVEPVGGGGGFLVIDGVRVQLSSIQFELMRLLAHRMLEQEDQPELVRGFIRSSELIPELSWDTAHPDDRHLKQLVRRLRRSLSAADVADLVEARHGLGYRLRVVPITSRTHRAGGS